jgi:hypothetical protein
LANPSSYSSLSANTSSQPAVQQPPFATTEQMRGEDVCAPLSGRGCALHNFATRSGSSPPRKRSRRRRRAQCRSSHRRGEDGRPPDRSWHENNKPSSSASFGCRRANCSTSPQLTLLLGGAGGGRGDACGFERAFVFVIHHSEGRARTLAATTAVRNSSEGIYVRAGHRAVDPRPFGDNNVEESLQLPKQHPAVRGKRHAEIY